MIEIKVIFLDIDGVLNHLGCKSLLPDSCIYFVEDEKILLLKEIIDATGAKIVLSSTWRYGMRDLALDIESSLRDDFVLLRDKLLEYGIEIFSRTPIHSDGYRGKEIKEWLDYYTDVDRFVILDDNTDMKPVGRYFIQTSFQKGLCKKHVKRAIKILNRTEGVD